MVNITFISYSNTSLVLKYIASFFNAPNTKIGHSITPPYNKLGHSYFVTELKKWTQYKIHHVIQTNSITHSIYL